MIEPSTPLSILATRLLPWLQPTWRQLNAARTTGRLGHAWLLAGPGGVGKINLALAFAHRLLGPPHTAAPAALRPAEVGAVMRERHHPSDHHPDLHWLFPEEDKRTISVDQVRAMCETLALKPHRGASKVVVIEPAESMTTAAANALLKTLEEPPGDAYLLLVSHQPGRLPATIRSRCQRINIARPRSEEIAAWLAEPGRALQPEVFPLDSPLAIAGFLYGGIINDNNSLESNLVLVSRDKIDPQSVADTWLKLDHELVLTWLMRRIHLSIRARMAANASTKVTDPDTDALHNAWSTLTLRTLFDQHQAAERLLNQLGAGTNVELALRALLLGFRLNRGRS